MAAFLLVLAPPFVLAQEPQPLLGAPLRGLTPTERQLFEEGLAEFETPITEAEGLGPVFNGISCVECHNHPAPGGFGTRTVTRFARSNPFNNLNSLGGPLLQEFAIDLQCIEVVPPEADHAIQRGTPPLFGSGLMEGVLDSDVVANEANQPPHLSGRVRFNQPIEDQNGPIRIGRFGWKVNQATVMSFTIGAASNEIGLTSVLSPNEHAPQGDQALLAACDNVADPEEVPDQFGETRIDRWRNFQRYLAPAPQTPRSGHAGEALFEAVGCADCHIANYTTGPAAEAALSGQLVRPYSNFLLHDMGLLGDGMQEGQAASKTEMGTRGLWGMRHRTALLHDGRASGGTFEQNAELAILEHDGEAAFAVVDYLALTNAQQLRLLGFLASLGQAEFDADSDNDRDGDDWVGLASTFTGPAPAVPIAPEDPGALADVDQDGDFDLVEFGQFQEAFGALAPPEGTASAALDLAISSGGSSMVQVAPGATVDYEVHGELSDSANQGLALFAFDLAFDGGALNPADAPTAAPMTDFATPLGLSNPAGFGGTPSGGTLVQVGGAQNTILNQTAVAPNGTPALGVALPGSPQLLVRGSLVAPQAPGSYTLGVAGVRANVIAAGSSGVPFWSVQRAADGAATGLVIEVDGPTSYCAASPNSVGAGSQLQSVSGFGSAAATFTVTDTPNQPGLLFTGPNQIDVPFGCGRRCIGGTIVRHAPVFPSGNTVTFTVDMTVGGGAAVNTNAQFWYRDSVGCPSMGGYNLSNAIGL